ncbi:hypothetical protein CSV80_15955 [Sporosarcina sp. P12(2017)]|uniref:nitroreductase family protein n=1 Tax=unclassified Sporosarcina TaxID=2647733 RepID=UPI000C16E727|nr:MULTISPECIES: nitroreductase family protein [unclassified Sporosarcina]PIC56158.1 hypothetical protein CSV81_15960 [Sporosarcina sp. P10]PIC59486.1 hypothetical protein CSV80_15955 [Sporosarcina sp. P12(2017)]
MKEIAKIFLPRFILKILMYIKFKLDLLLVFFYDYSKYLNSSFGNPKNNSEEQLRNKITLYYHALEKGLSHSNIRLGFGQYALNELFETLEEYVQKGFSIEDIRFKTGISTIQEYINLHNLKGQPTTDLSSRLSQLANNITKSGGSLIINKNDYVNGSDSSFADLVNSRHSVRSFSNETVDLDLINQAINLSMKTPSACNRQPWNVYVIKNNELRKKILKVQGGLNGFGENMDSLLMITTDNSAYGSANERNAGYIDGGLFSMTLLYSLHNLGLATCMLNASFNINKYKSIGKLLDLKKGESIIMFIGVGHMPTSVTVTKSQRDNFRDITKYYI